MTLNYYDNKVPHLIEEYYQLTFTEDEVPFQSTVLPIGLTHLTHIFYGDQKAIVEHKEMPITNTIVSGQFFRSYQFYSTSEAMSFGISFHPTALFKILNTDISALQDKHVLLSSFHPKLFAKIKSVFEDFRSGEHQAKQFDHFFSNLNLTINNNTKHIDIAINLIKDSNGLITISDILEQINISQKTLETQFKKIVGLTPGKYIRLFRFLQLMRKYESQETTIKDLMFMFGYYDRSHFSKDFRLFMNETPKSYFKKDYPLLKAVFRNQ
ncbi:AraC family transcriptional regulator [uncultured Psychroserpens sp.]|uniref:helix-turn-helix domain-containing protein n=1 Tax=uncultured Psychroserpens sp. TaxID=255436 RepID=UPI0026349837|nr:helix-turn-helix domain-containing protein [uncultured Psychroserpens sp.]